MRIVAPDYLPSEMDVLRARTKTTGIYETRFQMGQLSIQYVGPLFFLGIVAAPSAGRLGPANLISHLPCFSSLPACLTWAVNGVRERSGYIALRT